MEDYILKRLERVSFTMKEKGYCPPLFSSLSSSLLFLPLLNNHIQLITLANKYQHRNSSGNNNNA